MLITGDKVQLRPITAADFTRIVTWSNDVEVCRYIDGDFPATLDDCQIWLQRADSDRHNQRFAITILENSELIGDIELDHITWRSGDAELRIRIGERNHWDKGYGTDAVRALLSHAFVHMNLSRIYLRVFSENQRAIRCYEKSGLKKEGRLMRRSESGQPREILLMRILKQEFHRKYNTKPSATDAKRSA